MSPSFRHWLAALLVLGCTSAPMPSDECASDRECLAGESCGADGRCRATAPSPLPDAAAPTVVEGENTPFVPDCDDCGSASVGRYGSVIGTWRGVNFYSNGDSAGCAPCTASLPNGLQCGLRCDGTRSPQTAYGLAYQCIEGVRRYYALVYGDRALGASTGNAITYERQLPSLGFTTYASGSTQERPMPDDIVVLRGGGYGHIGLVAFADADSMTIFQQNAGPAFIRIALQARGGVITAATPPSPLSGYRVIGWYRKYDWRSCRDAPCPDGMTCGASQRCEAGSTSLPMCPSGRVPCGGACVDLQSNAQHCGRCDAPCASDSACDAGRCAPICRPPRQRCGDLCVDASSDLANCGGCGRRCASGQLCSAGACRTSCGAGTLECGAVCVDPLRDASNCGRCGAVCAAPRASTACAAGRCVISRCEAGSGDCDGNAANGCEVSTAVDPSHCGGCGRRCAAGQTCRGGACAAADCGAGLSMCAGACVDPRSDARHCGACGRTCSAPVGGSAICAAGVCQPRCPAGATACGGRCVDLARDPANCGGCGATCSSGQTCDAGRCTTTCTGGTTRCGGSCVHVATDTSHCGGCDRRCGADDRCLSGRCVTPTCDGYLRFTAPSNPFSTRPGATVTFSFTAPGCPSSQRYELVVRACCVSGDCETGYQGGRDPDIACGSARSGSFTGTRTDIAISSGYAAGWYRVSVRPLMLDQYAAPFLRMQVR